MSVTLQQIAEAAGVSRGTVDRAMNNRGRVNPVVEEKIKRLAKEMGYQPNRAGRALAMAKHSVKIGILLQASDTPFMQNVEKGISDAAVEAADFGIQVVVRKMRHMDSTEASSILKEMALDGCNALGLVPVEDEIMADAIRKITENGIPVVTFNGDIQDTGRLCFVGQNSEQSGKTAAGLMAEITSPNGMVLIISGYPSNHGHRNRVKGFLEEIKLLRPDIRLIDIQYNFDDSQLAERIAAEMLREYPYLAGIYIASAGATGVCRALEKSGKCQKVKLISHDLVGDNLGYLKKGTIRFLLGQDSYSQGYKPVRILMNKLLDGKDPEEEFQYTNIDIMTRYNC